MSTFRHQWSWDFRRLRAAWLAWILLLAGSFGLLFLGLQADQPARALLGLGQVLTFFSLYVLPLLLVARLIFTTPFAGTTAFWMTRPASRRGLFWEKSAFLLLLIWLPAVLATAAFLTVVTGEARLVVGSVAFVATLTAFLYLSVALLAAQSEGIPALIARSMAAAGLVVVAVLAFQSLSRHTDQLPVQLEGLSTAQPGLMTAVLGFALAALAVIGAWILAALLRKRTAGLVVFASGLLVIASLSSLFRIHRVTLEINPGDPAEPLTLRVLDRGEQPAEDEQRLLPQLAAELGPRQALWIRRMSGQLIPPGSKAALSSFSTGMDPEPFLRQLGNILPGNPRVIPLNSQSHTELTDGSLDGVTVDASGSVEGLIVDVAPLASFPLRVGSAAQLEGVGMVRCTAIRESSDRYRIELATIQRVENNGLGLIHYMNNGQRLAFALHDGARNVLLVPAVDSYGQRSRLTAGIESMRSTLELDRSQLRQVLGTNDLSGFTLEVLELRPVALARGEFAREDWVAYSNPDPVGGADAFPWREAVLPEQPSPADLATYLDSILFGLPNDLSQPLREEVQARFDALGADHLEALLARLPLHNQVRDFAYRTIQRHADRRHLPALLEALRRDERLVSLFRERGWDTEARPILRERLARHVPLEWGAAWQAVVIVAGAPDPATYADLQWHTIHAGTGYRPMREALAACPGFPLEETLAAAWLRTRAGIGHHDRDLAVFALPLGDREALRRSLADGLTAPDRFRQERLAAALAAPAESAPLPWAHQHFAELRFDPETETYRRTD